MTDEPQMPSNAEMQAGAQVVEAGQQAADAEPDPKKKRGAAARAIKQEAETKGWEISTEQADMLAGMVAAKIMETLPDATADKIAERGGYDKLPEPLSVPAAPTGAGTLPAEPAVQPERDQAPGGERTRGGGSFARWFRSGQ